MALSIPGPSSTESGLPVETTGSPRMISPTNPSSPTLQISNMRAPLMPLAMTAGPAIL